MKNYQWKKTGYIIGIGFGIVMVVAFISSQLLYPIFLGNSEKAEVPDVVGLGLSTAKQKLRENRLHIVVKDSVWSEEAPVEYVLEQKPEAGKQLKQDQAVYVVVSRGSRVITVPQILGMPYQQAYIMLRTSSLKTVIADSLYSEKYPANSVIRCSPSPGNKIEKGKTVKVFLSRGSQNPRGDTGPIDFVESPGDPVWTPGKSDKEKTNP
ncbi:MAG TPA: PASTA domain-containing protein [Candidatus Cloacimonadota bacterium]|nr:PASTA domain-containing protein [Candidatus Cloacimonadota bacterium]